MPEGGLFPGGVSQHALRQTPPMNRMTNSSKNITLATTSLRPVITNISNSVRPTSFTMISILFPAAEILGDIKKTQVRQNRSRIVNMKQWKQCRTRMHSSRMRTARALTVSPGRGVLMQKKKCKKKKIFGGAYLVLRGVLSPEGCT